MKPQYKKNITQFNIRVNEKEYNMIRVLKEKHSINLSGAFKGFLARLYDKMEGDQNVTL